MDYFDFVCMYYCFFASISYQACMDFTSCIDVDEVQKAR